MTNPESHASLGTRHTNQNTQHRKPKDEQHGIMPTT